MDKKKKKKLKLKKSIRDFIFSKNFLILIVIIIVLLFSVMLGISFVKKVSLVNKAPDDEKNNYNDPDIKCFDSSVVSSKEHFLYYYVFLFLYYLYL